MRIKIRIALSNNTSCFGNNDIIVLRFIKQKSTTKMTMDSFSGKLYDSATVNQQPSTDFVVAFGHSVPFKAKLLTTIQFFKKAINKYQKAFPISTLIQLHQHFHYFPAEWFGHVTKQNFTYKFQSLLVSILTCLYLILDENFKLTLDRGSS